MFFCMLYMFLFKCWSHLPKERQLFLPVTQVDLRLFFVNDDVICLYECVCVYVCVFVCMFLKDDPSFPKYDSCF